MNVYINNQIEGDLTKGTITIKPIENIYKCLDIRIRLKYEQ